MEVPQDRVVDGEFTLLDLLEIMAYISKSKVESLKGLELGGDACGEGADGDVTDITQQMLNTDLLGFLGFDDGGSVHECLGRGGTILSLRLSYCREARVRRGRILRL